MITTTTANAPDLDEMGDSLSRNVLFVSITVHMWRGQRKIDAANVTLGQADLDQDLRTDPRWKLMPRVWASRFNEIESKIRGLVDSYTPRNTNTFSLPLRGIDIIPRKSAKAFFDRLKELETQVFNPLADRFCAEWAAITANLCDRLTKDNKPEVWGEVAKHLPSSPAAVRARFHIEKRVIPISFDTRIEVLNDADAEEFVDEVQKGVEEFKREATMTIVAGLQAELNDAVDNLVNRIGEGGVIRGGTIGMVRAAFEKIAAFDFAATAELKARMKAVQDQLDGLDHTDLNKDIRHESGEIAAKLAGSLKALRAQTAEEAKALRGFGKKTRALEV